MQLNNFALLACICCRLPAEVPLHFFAAPKVQISNDSICAQVHDDPTTSPVDGPTQWPLRHFEELLKELIDIATVTKGKKQYKIDLSPYNPDK